MDILYWTREVQRLVQDEGYHLRDAISKVKARKKKFKDDFNKYGKEF